MKKTAFVFFIFTLFVPVPLFAVEQYSAIIEEHFDPVLVEGMEGTIDWLWTEHLERRYGKSPRLDFWRLAGDSPRAGQACVVKNGSKDGQLHIIFDGPTGNGIQGIRSCDRFNFFHAPISIEWCLKRAKDSDSYVIICLSDAGAIDEKLKTSFSITYSSCVKKSENLVAVDVQKRGGQKTQLVKVGLNNKANRIFRLELDTDSFRLFVDDAKQPVAEGKHGLTEQNLPLGAHLYLLAQQLGSAKVEAVIDDVIVSQKTNKTHGQFITVDISKYATMALKDDTPGDGQGGWTDQGSNDMRNLPVGDRVFDGVPFFISSDAQRDNKSVIVLGSKEALTFLPEKVENIPINSLGISKIHFLHTAAYYGGGEDIGYYDIRVEKHPPAKQEEIKENIALARISPEELEVLYRIPINNKILQDWWNPHPAPNGSLAWVGPGGAASKVGVYHFVWYNPKPGNRVISINFVKNESSQGIPILLAVTAEEYGEDSSAGAPSNLAEISALKDRINEQLRLLSVACDDNLEWLGFIDESLGWAQTSGLWTAESAERVEKLGLAVRSYRQEYEDILNGLLNKFDDMNNALARNSLAGGSVKNLLLIKSSLLKAEQYQKGELVRLIDQTQQKVLHIMLEFADNGLKNIEIQEPTEANYFGRATNFWAKVTKLYCDDVRERLAKPVLTGRDLYVASLSARHAVQFAIKANRLARMPGAKDKPILSSRRLDYNKSWDKRLSVCIDGHWEFHPGGPLDRSPKDGWFEMPVPHLGWQAEPTPVDQSFYDFCGIAKNRDYNVHHAWYRTDLQIPSEFENQIVKIAFRQVFTYAEIYVNGIYCGKHLGSFSPFEIDITNAINPGGRNVMEVLVQDKFFFSTGQPYQGIKSPPALVTSSYQVGSAEGGIVGDVFLVTYPVVHVEDVFVQTSVRNKLISVDIWLTNKDKAPHTIELANEVYDGSQKVLALPSITVTLESGETRKVTTSCNWDNPQLWGIGDKYGNPYLYYLGSKILDGSYLIDKKYTRFGFREFRISGTQFLLNEKPIFIQGETLAMAGGAYTQNENRYYFNIFYNLLRKANVNLVRCFDPQCPAAYQVADELGMLITEQFQLNHGLGPRMPENNMYDPAWTYHIKQEYREWVRSRRNHPSIVMWSMENEHLSRQVEWKGRRIPALLALDSVVRKEDDTRPLIHHGNQGFAENPGFEVAVLHYVTRGMISNWAQKYRKPVIIGEWFPFGPHQDMTRHNDSQGKLSPAKAVEIMADSFKNEIEYWRSLGIPGIMPFQLNWSLFDTSEHSHMGPWWDKWKWPFLTKDYPSPWYSMWIDVDWPALSGEGLKVRRYRNTSRNAVNWFDPARSAYVTNSIYDAIREALAPMPQLPDMRVPEVIVKVTKNGASVPHAIVVLTPAEGQPTDPIAVRSDAEGRAWFRLELPGDYFAETFSGTAKHRITAANNKLNIKPGYDNIAVYDIAE